MNVSRTDKIFFSTVYFVQGAVALSGLALLHFQKDVLGLSAAELATFSALITLLAWSFKPIYGLISDLFPIRGQRRRPYLMLTSLLTFFSYLYLGTYSHDYMTTLVPLVLANIGLGFTDVLCDGLVVERSTKKNVGKLQNICWSAKFAALFIASILGGFLNEKLGIVAEVDPMTYLPGIKTMFFMTAVLPLIVFFQVLFLDEPRVRKESKFTHLMKSWGHSTWMWIRRPAIKRSFWGFLGAMVFIFVWRATPSGGSPMTYFVINERGFNDLYLGNVAAISHVGALIGSVLYGRWVDKLPIRKVFFWTILLGTGFGFLDLLIVYEWDPVYVLGFEVHYKTFNVLLSFVGGIIFYVSFLPLLKLAAMICPKKREATMFAIIASIMNIGLSVSSQLGGEIWEHNFLEDYARLDDYVITILLINLIVLPCILLLPKKQEPLKL